MPKKSNLSDFLKKYFNKYPNSNISFDDSIYINSSKKIICKCPIHGNFSISPNKLMSGQNCAECAGNVPIKDISDFLIRNWNKKNIKNYIYDESVYLGNGKKMKIKCKEHGFFYMKPNALLNGQGCHNCAKNKPYKDVDDFFDRNKENRNIIKYEIDKESFSNSKSKLKLKCNVHGWFSMNVHDLLLGCNCKKCAKCYKPKNIQEFLEINIDNQNLKKYNYKNSIYINALKKMQVNCSIHGDFSIRPSALLRGQGCSKCSNYGFNISKPATLYILNMKNKCGLEAIGYGITNNFTRRILQHEKNFRINKVDWVILETIYFEKGADCLNIENKIKSETNRLNFNVDGFRTESTDVNNLEKIYSIIENSKLN